LTFAQKKTKLYYNYPNCSAFWDEYNSIAGFTHPGSYGCGRAGKTNPPIWWSGDVWNHYNFQGGLDLSLLIMDHYAYTQDKEALKRYLPIVSSIVSFYNHHFPNKDSKGKVVFYPTQSIETWQCPNYPPNPSNCATNDMPTLAGLTAVLSRLTKLDQSFSSPDQRAEWQQYLSNLPPLPMTNIAGSAALAPCQVCPPGTSNSENAELYAVHPYRLYTVGRQAWANVNLAPAVQAFQHVRFGSDEGWNQNAMDAALLGLGPKAMQLVEARAAMKPAPGYRFPTFMPHLQDYQPSLDHLAVFNNALQYMLIQLGDDDKQSVVLLPTWPCAWDVNFKLNAPLNTVIEGSLKGGQLSFTVTPSGRRSDVKTGNCFR